VKIKINGAEQEVTVEEVLREFQKDRTQTSASSKPLASGASSKSSASSHLEAQPPATNPAHHTARSRSTRR
jgi:hypothetical protein